MLCTSPETAYGKATSWRWERYSQLSCAGLR